MPGTIKVLMLAADSRSGGLRLDHEIREAFDAVRSSRAASELEIATELAVRPGDLARALLRHDPQIVHFAGHGDRNAILLDGGERFRGDQLAALLTSFRRVRVVVLNACSTLPVARMLSKVVDYTVAMERAIDDDDAVGFSAAFYAALAFGRPVPFAFDLARNAMRPLSEANDAIPRLLVHQGADKEPLEGKVSPAPHAAGFDRQVSGVEDVEASDSAEIGNEAQGVAATPISQETSVKRSRFEGPLKVGNRLTK